MRSNVKLMVVASALVAGSLCAQTPPTVPGASPTAMNAPAQSAPAPGTSARPKLTAREPADARVCLEFPTNLQVIRCAEKYRHMKGPA